MRSTLSPPIGREILPDDFRTSSVTTVPVKLLERSGVLEHYPQEVFFVAPLARGIDQIEAIDARRTERMAVACAYTSNPPNTV